ncbi:hypothetical protein [uncultured Gammaproteobacteria bacterium]|jgi:uncharacterized protein (TIGR02646 family)|nr:hypothetical protein [uncultured Gammaproteobacteria bacterium]CAC9541660.1 hypothetical protein [uncultured Gammaproteobacteria bacterium]CAC9551698.1 hypothetical protein [uncultured Gammaproteobacteria bacterium]
MSNVQKQKPSRTCTKTYSSYRSFRSYLADDFNHRCGYCDDPDIHYGQTISYHIDHFKPKSKFPDLETNYSNLVYSCPYCNGAKSDKWQEVDGFIDPCDNEYDKHLERTDKGKITCVTQRGQYIVENLRLYLKRHELIWSLAILEWQKQQLNQINTIDSNELMVLRKFKEIQEQIDKYNNILKDGSDG